MSSSTLSAASGGPGGRGAPPHRKPPRERKEGAARLRPGGSPGLRRRPRPEQTGSFVSSDGPHLPRVLAVHPRRDFAISAACRPGRGAPVGVVSFFSFL
jgi:hypothetical protein